MNALTWYVIIKRLETYGIGLLPIATVGIMSDKSKPFGNAANLLLMCFSSCGRVDAISPEGSRVYQVTCNSFSMLALQLKVYYSFLVATFNQFFSIYR